MMHNQVESTLTADTAHFGAVFLDPSFHTVPALVSFVPSAIIVISLGTHW